MLGRRDRPKGDFLASRDFEDIVVLVDGRSEIVGELQLAEPELRQFVAEAVREMQSDPLFHGGLGGALGYFDQARVPVVDQRLKAIAELTA